MIFQGAARIGATVALLASALAYTPAPAQAGGPPPALASAFTTVVHPLIALVRAGIDAKNMADAGIFDTARFQAAWTDGAREAELDVAMPRGTHENQITTGSIEAVLRPGGQTKKLQVDLLASVAIPFGRLPALSRMDPIYADMDAGIFSDCRTVTCENARAILETVVENGRGGRFLDMIGAVNRSVNKLVAYRRDSDVHGVVDYWAKPSQILDSGTGDCEDYAILKMAVLAKAGVSKKSMSLVVLRDERRDVYHAVLAIRTSHGSFILDNLDPVVRQDVELPHYTPLYSISAGRGYIYGRRGGGSTLSASARFDAIAPGEGLYPDPNRGAAFASEGTGTRGPM